MSLPFWPVGEPHVEADLLRTLDVIFNIIVPQRPAIFGASIGFRLPVVKNSTASAVVRLTAAKLASLLLTPDLVVDCKDPVIGNAGPRIAAAEAIRIKARLMLHEADPVGEIFTRDVILEV